MVFNHCAADFIAKVKDKAENVGQTIAAKVDSAANIKVPSPQVSRRTSNTSDGGSVTAAGQKLRHPSPLVGRSQGKESTSTELPKSPALVAAQILMSCLHAWGLDAELDQLCTSKLGLLRPRRPISFGFLSRASGHMSLSLPGWYRHFGSGKTAADTRQQSMALATAGRWQLSSAVTTQHLLAVISVANTLMSMANATFISSRRTTEPLRQLPKSVGFPVRFIVLIGHTIMHFFWLGDSYTPDLTRPFYKYFHYRLTSSPRTASMSFQIVYLFKFSFLFFFCLVSCGSLSSLLVSVSVHIKYLNIKHLLSYCTVWYKVAQECAVGIY